MKQQQRTPETLSGEQNAGPSPLCPQRIAHRTRQLIQSLNWEWRHSNMGDDAETVRAVAILRRDYLRAQRWLWNMSSRTPDRLPIGNGCNGPWHLVAHVSDNGNLGVVNVAHGTATEYGVAVPDYVLRFSTRADRAQTHNEAGGTGGVPIGWRQIVVMLPGSADVTTDPQIPATRLIFGLSTCYGSCGTNPAHATYNKSPHPEAIMEQTTEPQREEIPLNCGVEKSQWEAFAKTSEYRRIINYPRRCTIQLMDSNYSIGENRLQYVYVTGTHDERRTVMIELRDAFRTFVATTLALDMLRRLSKNSFRLPSGEGNGCQGAAERALAAAVATLAIEENSRREII